MYTNLNQQVVGSNPTWGTTTLTRIDTMTGDLFDPDDTYNPIHDAVFNDILPGCKESGFSVDEMLYEVAIYLGVDKRNFMINFMFYPQWPSPASLIKKYGEL